MRIPLGDFDLVVEARLPGLHPTVLWRFGPPTDRPGPFAPVAPATAPFNPNFKDVTFVASLQDTKEFSFSITGKDKIGHDTPLGSTAPTFTLDRDDIVTLTVSDDGFSGEVAALGPLGVAVLSVEGVTDGGVTYKGSAAVEVVAGDVVSVDFAFGTPQDVEPPATPTV